MTDTHPADHAVRAFWAARTDAADKQSLAGKTDAGRRGAVTAGKHLEAMEAIVCDEFIAAGFDRSCVHRGTGLELPGFYRPAKKWDVVVIDEGRLVAAIEFKSQVGSFGNNFNNRTEEVIGSAVDVWRAYEAGVFGRVRPWLGYFFVLECAPKSTTPVRLPGTVYPVDEVFQGSSYQDRYGILLRRLLRERLYDAACFLTTSADGAVAIAEPDPELGFAAFAAKIAGRAAEIQSLKSTDDLVRTDGVVHQRIERVLTTPK